MRSRTRVTTLSLLAVIGFVLFGLFVANHALEEEDETHATHDAELSARLLESYLSMHAAVLASFHGMYTDMPAGTEHARFTALARSLTTHATGFQQLWTADSTGRVLHDTVIARTPWRARTGAPIAVGVDLDTVGAFALGRTLEQARARRELRVSRGGTLEDGRTLGVVLVYPVVRGGRVLGFAGGVVSETALFGSIAAPPRSARLGMELTDEEGVLAARLHAAGTPEAPIRNELNLRAPDGTEWSLAVRYDAPNSTLRRMLWIVGVGVLLVLTLALMHERRQSERIGERSAELERLSAELLAANRAKSEFLANISHELRTPLNAIVGFADLLRDGVYGELAPRQVNPVQRIEASATHLRGLVDQILDLAKIAAGRLEVHVETIDLRPFVIDVASEVESLLSEKGLSLSLAVGATLPRVRTDPSHLRQILVNLLGNAVKYTDTGSVAVRARLVRAGETLPSRSGGRLAPPVSPVPREGTAWIALQVADTGRGVPAEDRERIFEEFEQVNAGGRGDSARRGTGLGLPISRRLARLLGGDVTLDSEAGVGSTFTLWLPVDETRTGREPRGERTPSGEMAVGG